MRFIRDTLTTFSAQIAYVLLGVAASVVVARVLGPSGKGEYSLVVLVPTMLALVGNLGIGIANLYFGGKKKYEWANLASNSLVSALTIGVLSSAIFLAYFFVVRPSFLSEVKSLYLVVATMMVPFSLLTSYLTHLLLGQGRIRQYNLLQVAPGAVCLGLILILLLGFHGGIFSAVIAWAGGTLMATVLVFLLVRKVTRIGWSFRPSIFKDSIKFGVQGYLGNVIQFLNYRVDMLMVAYFMDTAAVGYYSVAVALAEALWYFPGAVGTIVFARTPRLSAEEANRTTPRICRTTFFITILAALALFGLGRYFITWLFGSGFLPALKPLWYLLPGIVALSICKVLSAELAGRGKPIINAVVAGISLAVNIPLNLLWIPRMGIAGAALASTVSYSVSAVVTLVAFTRVSGNKWFDTVIVKPQDLALYASFLATVGNRIRTLAVGSRE